jgi:hypothetical protein
MSDIGRLLSDYRECGRTIWNTYFRPRAAERDEWDLHDEFEDVCVLLFASLVLHPMGRRGEKQKAAGYEKAPDPLMFLRVVPRHASGSPVQINRDVRRSGYWDHPVKLLRPNDADLRFIDFFDFDVLGVRDFAFCLVRVVASDHLPELVGRDALIAFGDAEFLALSKADGGAGLDSSA